MSYREFVASLAKALPTQRERLEHASLGLIGECGELADAWKKHIIYGRELDLENVIEELGDLRFYLQMAMNEFPEAEFEEPDRGLMMREELLIFSLAEMIGKFAMSFDRTLLFTIHSRLDSACRVFSLTLAEVERENIEKLLKRYPNGHFTEEHASLRLDKRASVEETYDSLKKPCRSCSNWMEESCAGDEIKGTVFVTGKCKKGIVPTHFFVETLTQEDGEKICKEYDLQ